MKFESNLSIQEASLRYAIMMLFPIIGGITGHLSIMLLGIPVFLTGILGYCPIYDLMGIDHSKKEHPFNVD